MLDVGDAGRGDGVALAVGAFAVLGRAGDGLAVAGQPGEGRVDLAVGQWLAAAEVGVVVPLEVVAVTRLSLQQAQQGERDTHTRENTLSVYARQVAGARADFPATV